MLTGAVELLGRDAELCALADLVRSERIVTIVGPGGVGKTALAARLVDQLASGRSDVGYLPTRYVVPLGDVADVSEVRAVVARHLGLQDSGERGFGEMIGAGESLFLLDGCEHVVDAAAAVVADLLEVPGLRVLATSREPLAVVGEHVFALGPLPLPDDPEEVEGNPAVRLFLQRSAAAGASPPRPEERADLVRLVQALDGLPLALELAAGRSRALSVHDLADRLDRGPELLRSAARGLPERHRGAVEMVDWSYRLLDPDERRLFLAMSACAGGGDLAAVEALGTAAGITGPTLPDVLDRLVAKSLVFRTQGRHGARYEMLRMLRSFAAQRLAEDQELTRLVQEAHADHFVGRCDDFQAVVRRAWRPGTFDLLLGDFDNVRAAASWCLAHDTEPDRTFRLVAPLFYLTVEMGSAEIAALAASALDRWPGSAHPLASDVGGVLAESRIVLGQPEAAREVAVAALEAATSPTGVALAHRALAQLVEEVDEALEHVRLCGEAASAAGVEPLGLDAASVAVRILHAAGQEEAARSLASDAMERSAPDNVYAHAAVTQDLGLMLLPSDTAAAQQLVELSHDEWSALQCPYGLMLSVRARGSVATECGDRAAAAQWLLEAIRRARRLGYRHEQATTIAAAVPLLARTGHEQVAAALLAGLRASDAFVERLHVPLLEPVERSLTGQTAAAAARGRTLRMSDLLDLAQRTLREVRDEPPVEATAPVVDPTLRELVRTGSLWRLTYAGTSVHLPAMKGLADLAALLRVPGEEVPAMDLAEPTGSAARQADLGERIDGQARAAYKERIRVLQDELDDADAAGDPERGAAAQQELDALTAELAAAYGLHGPRRTGDPAERARAAVTQRIRSAVTKVAAVHPSAGEHLARTVVTGRFCCYRPTDGPPWVVRT